MKSVHLVAFFSLILTMIFIPTYPAFAVPYYSTDFNAGAPAEFSGVTTTESVQGFSGYGPAGNQFSGDFLRNPTVPAQTTTLTLNGLPSHTSVDIEFLLAIIDSWDDTTCVISPSAAPDFFNIEIDDVLVFSEAMENACGTQTYVPPAGVELARHVQLGFNPDNTFHTDSAYDMGQDPTFQNVAHSSSTLKIEWYSSGAGWQGGLDESWAIDNVRVTLLGTESVIGGEIIPIESTSLILAGAQSTTLMIPLVLCGIGIGLFLVFRKSENS